MKTPNNIIIKEEEISDEELFLDFKETYLNLQKFLLKGGFNKQVKEIGKIYSETKDKIQS